MKCKLVNLSVHKNNKVQKKRKQNRKTMISAVKDMSNSTCVAGFYFISWNEKGDYHQDRLYDPEAALGLNQIPSYVSGAIQRAVNERDSEGE